MSRRLPKSLHTITALINLAHHLMMDTGSTLSPDHAVDLAAGILGYPDREDPDFLLVRALATLKTLVKDTV
jgi:hypothetical protein